ncbi:MAG: exosortase-associated EpsI family protein [Verrucomicrobia bacterium]|nr:exosortase-associated EpsI family protein [Verrucomicrobiota bacterium]
MVAVLLMAACAGALVRMKASQRLGAPGVKVAALPGTNVVKVLLPERVLNYESRELEVSDGERNVLPADTSYGKRVYSTADGFQVQVSVVLMGTDRTSIHKPEFCLAGNGLTIDTRETTVVPLTRPHAYDLPVRKFTCTRIGRSADGREVKMRALYVYWFVAGDALSANDWERMPLSAWELLRTGTLQRWAYVSFFAWTPPGREDEAFARIQQLIAASVPEFQTTAGPARPAAGPVTAGK